MNAINTTTTYSYSYSVVGTESSSYTGTAISNGEGLL
jgi:hypothetical protein